jgi:putative transcriptional regulator
LENSIAVRRKKLKLSQAEVAQLTHVTRQTINAIENDKYDPSLALAFNLAHILQTTVDELFVFEQ